MGVAKNVAEAAHCPLVGITNNADPSELAGIGIHQPRPIVGAIRQYLLPIIMGPGIVRQCLFKKTGDGKVPEYRGCAGRFSRPDEANAPRGEQKRNRTLVEVRARSKQRLGK